MFRIRTIDTGDKLRSQCELIIGDHKEVFPLITTFWTRQEYEAQWSSSLHDLKNGIVNCCVLITDVQPPCDSVGISYWVLFREGVHVYLQERFSRDKYVQLIGPPKLAESYIAPRIQGTAEEHSCVSEWICSIEDLQP